MQTMNTVVLDIAMTPDPDGGGQWDNLHPMARARAKADAYPYVVEAVAKARIESIGTPCAVYADIYFNGQSKGGGTDFDNLAIRIGKLFLDPLCPDKVIKKKSGISHKAGLGLIPDDTVEHVVGILITRHPQSDRNHTVLTFFPPGGFLKLKEAAARARREEAQNRNRKGNQNDMG